jgi:uncharacterized membrane protein (TIGR02234 family)
MKRRTAILLWLGLTLIAFVFAGQPWYRVVYDFDGHSRELKASGLESWQAIVGLLWVEIAALVLVMFLQGQAKQIFAWFAAATTTALAIILCLPIFNTMSPALANKISSKSGITMPANQVVGGPVSHFATTANTGIFALVLLLLIVVQLFTALSVKKWNLKKQSSRFEAPATAIDADVESSTDQDPIQIWDSQRK